MKILLFENYIELDWIRNIMKWCKRSGKAILLSTHILSMWNEVL